VQETGKLIGVSFALTGFSVALVAGLMSGNPGVTVLMRALGALVVCRLLGGFLGFVGQRVAMEVGSARVSVRSGALAPGKPDAETESFDADVKIAA
jgi:hypothetical protein